MTPKQVPKLFRLSIHNQSHDCCSKLAPKKKKISKSKIKKGPAGIRTQVARFKVWSANHYTTEPFADISLCLYFYFNNSVDTVLTPCHFFFLRYDQILDELRKEAAFHRFLAQSSSPGVSPCPDDAPGSLKEQSAGVPVSCTSKI
jgi:hypothetical protein